MLTSKSAHGGLTIALATVLATVLSTTVLSAPTAHADVSVRQADHRPAETRPAATLTAKKKSRATLVTSPSVYVGGQGLTWTGRLGVRGKRKITLEQHLERPGDQWFATAGFTRKTNADGTFRFTFPAPGMFGISYRVRSGKIVTPKVTFDPKSQDVNLWVAGDDPDEVMDAGRARPDQPFDITIDITPDDPFPVTALGAPEFPGRRITLQRRVNGSTWKTIGTTKAGATGLGYVRGLVEPEGTVVYRARAEAWGGNGSKIGWFPSFPIRIDVDNSSAPGYDDDDRDPYDGDGSDDWDDADFWNLRTASGAVSGRQNAASATAGRTWSWGAPTYDFTWERGESLSSAPGKGTKRRGWWLDYADGLGRANRHNGALALESSRSRYGDGDYGTTSATLMGASQAYGRWELRMRARNLQDEEGGTYRLRAELVPANPADSACGARDITIAEFSGDGATMRFGLNSGNRQWNGTRQTSGILHADPAFGVEVTPKVVTWFMNGQAIGSVRASAVTGGVPMTMRMSLVGDGDREMQHASVISDWQRSWPLGRGKQSPSAPALKQSSRSTAC